MRLVIAGDIHGSSVWCGRLLERVAELDPDGIVLLGDILYHGPRNDLPEGYDPKQVIEQLRPWAPLIRCVQGNCDSHVDNLVLPFGCTDPYLVVEDEGRAIFCTHGHLWGPGLLNSANRMPSLRRGDALVFGHVHVKLDEDRDGVRIFNPGSVGIPRDGSHSFGLYEGGRFEHVLLS